MLAFVVAVVSIAFAVLQESVHSFPAAKCSLAQNDLLADRGIAAGRIVEDDLDKHTEDEGIVCVAADVVASSLRSIVELMSEQVLPFVLDEELIVLAVRTVFESPEVVLVLEI